MLLKTLHTVSGKRKEKTSLFTGFGGNFVVSAVIGRRRNMTHRVWWSAHFIGGCIIYLSLYTQKFRVGTCYYHNQPNVSCPTFGDQRCHDTRKGVATTPPVGLMLFFRKVDMSVFFYFGRLVFRGASKQRYS